MSTPDEKLEAAIQDLKRLIQKHSLVLDKYSSNTKGTSYKLKLQFDDKEVDLEKVFPTVNHTVP